MSDRQIVNWMSNGSILLIINMTDAKGIKLQTTLKIMM